MSDDCSKLTVYFGERDRVGQEFLADALAHIYQHHELQISVLLRGVAGYGAKHQMRTDRRLTLSEDLPGVSVAVDARPRVEQALQDVRALGVEGLVTLERARVSAGPLEVDGETKLTIYVGRHERSGGRPAHQVLVEKLHEAGVAGATVLLGVDGTVGGTRRRAHFFARNADVPLMVISVGDGDRIASLVPHLEQGLVTLERVRVLKRDGQKFAEPATDGALQKLMVYASEQAQHDGHPLYLELLRRLRRAGAAGATSLRGIWGYHGDHEPHGDTLWQLHRRVPVVTVIVDTPERIAQWFAIVDEVTSQTGLVTSEGITSPPLA